MSNAELSLDSFDHEFSTDTLPQTEQKKNLRQIRSIIKLFKHDESDKASSKAIEKARSFLKLNPSVKNLEL